MEKTHGQYKRLMALLIGVAIFSQYMILKTVAPAFSSGWPGSAAVSYAVAFLLSGSGVYSLMVLLPLWIFETKGWKIFNSEWDFDGYWLCSISYDPPDKLFLNTSALEQIEDLQSILKGNHGYVRIDQNAFSIWVREGRGFLPSRQEYPDLFWHAEAVGFSEKTSEVSIHFKTSVGRIEFRGTDSLRITERKGRRKRPFLMEGPFIMVPAERQFLIRGTIKYQRDLSGQEVQRLMQKLSR